MHSVFVNIVLLNVLIAIISDSYERVQEKFRARALLQRAQLLGAAIRFEMLVNSDSRHVRHGDVATLLDAITPYGFLTLSPNLGESRGYNMLAKIARGAVLMFVQDDWMLSEELSGSGWLKDAFAVLGDILYVGGDFTHIGSLLANNVARWDGATWADMGSGVTYSGEERYPKVWEMRAIDNDVGTLACLGCERLPYDLIVVLQEHAGALVPAQCRHDLDATGASASWTWAAGRVTSPTR